MFNGGCAANHPRSYDRALRSSSRLLPKTRKANEPALKGGLATVHLQAQLFVNLGR